MSNSILSVPGTLTAFTLSFGGITNGSGRQGTLVDNSTTQARRALIYAKIKSGASTPTAGATYDFYLIRFDKASTPTYASDNAGTADAAWTAANALYLGSIKCTASAATNFYGDFDTADVTSDIGPAWTIGVVNNSGQTVDATSGNHLFEYATVIDQIV